MAKDFRPARSYDRVVEERIARVVEECARQEESCLYTSTTLFLWLRTVRNTHGFFVVAPIILGGFASWSILTERANPAWVAWIVAAAALLAGLFPGIYQALKLDVQVNDIAHHAAEFKMLQDRFRQAKNIGMHKTAEELKAEFEQLMDRLDAARAASMTPPERFFRMAQRKIAKGHYRFAIDETTGE